MMCNILECNAEEYIKLMYYYFHSNSQKPFCKEIMRVCENHARKITSDDLDSLYHIIFPNIDNTDIKNLLEQRFSANQDANIVEQMFKIQIAVFYKNGPLSVTDEELCNELVQIKQNIQD